MTMKNIPRSYTTIQTSFIISNLIATSGLYHNEYMFPRQFDSQMHFFIGTLKETAKNTLMERNAAI